MIEYLFFNAEISMKFIALLKQKKVDWEEGKEDVHGSIILRVSEDIEEDLWDELDNVYDDLSEEDQLLLEAAMADDDDVSTAGIYIQLKGGKQTVADINPDVMNRMLKVISMEEFNAFIEVIVNSVEEPDDTAICQRH